MNYSIDAVALLAVLPFRGDTDRLLDVQIYAGRVWTTDGHLLIAHKLKQQEDTPDITAAHFLIDLANSQDAATLTAMLKACIKVNRYTPSFVDYNTESGVLHYGAQTLNLPVKPTPEALSFEATIPKLKNLGAVRALSLDGRYIGQLAKLSGGGKLLIYPTVNTGGIMFITPPSGVWDALLMPVGKGPCNKSRGEPQLSSLWVCLAAAKGV